MPIIVTNDGRIPLAEIEPDRLDVLRKRLTREDPRWVAACRGASEPANMDRYVSSFRIEGDHLVLPRGRVKEASRILNQPIIDRSYVRPAIWPQPISKRLREHQSPATNAVESHHSGVIKMPTGSGKTFTTFECARRVGQSLLVVCPQTGLADQWIESIVDDYGVPRETIGMVYEGKFSIGDFVTIALPNSLTPDRVERLIPTVGMVALDECHHGAATTYYDSIASFPARYRIGVSADPRRRDRADFLIRDLFGRTIYRMTRDHAEEKNVIVPVVVRLVFTDWPDYGKPARFDEQEKAMMADERRLSVILDTVRRAEKPCVVFCRQVRSVQILADRLGCPVLIGSEGSKSRKAAFNETKRRLGTGIENVAVATYDAFGEGQDVAGLASVVCATPLGKDERGLRFNQVRGRASRLASGKDRAMLYYICDHRAYPGMGRTLWNWNDGAIEVQRGDRWVSAIRADLNPDPVF